MLVPHGGLHILVAHGPHDGSQIPSMHQNPSAIVMSSTIQNQILREAGFPAGLAKPVAYCGQMSRGGALGRKYPAARPRTTALPQKIKQSIAHRNEPSSFRSLAVGDEDQRVLPIQVFNAQPAEFSFVSHPRISHQDDDVAEEFSAGLPPFAGGSSRQQLP